MTDQKEKAKEYYDLLGALLSEDSDGYNVKLYLDECICGMGYNITFGLNLTIDEVGAIARAKYIAGRKLDKLDGNILFCDNRSSSFHKNSFNYSLVDISMQEFIEVYKNWVLEWYPDFILLKA